MRPSHASIAAVMTGLSVVAVTSQTAAPTAKPERIDYMAFAQGSIPVSVGGAGAKLGADFESAVRITDGDPAPFTVVNRAAADTDTEFVYHLPAATTFDRFAVPNMLETPSPTATFTRLVEVHGSVSSATDGFTLLASTTLQTHKARGQITEMVPVAKRPVRWVKVRLVGGINIQRPPSSFEFSEIVGNGTQDTPQLSTQFTGAWRAQANRVRLTQKGPVVSGCYDEIGELTGTVSGNILRATGMDRSDKTPSQFILAVVPDGSLRGVRSSNNGPFRLYSLAPAANVAECKQPTPPTLGCGSVIHGITFGYDSAEDST